MKKLAASLVVLVLALGFAAAVSAGSDQPAPTAKYICTHDKIGADKAGKCPICGEEMRAAGTYVCPHCDTTSDHAGKCPCGQDYVKTEMAGKKCAGCGYIIAKDAAGCPVCKKMHEHDEKQAS